jgi:hypothetical protein
MRLRQLRTLSAIDALQGERVRVASAPGKAAAWVTLRELLKPWQARIKAIADQGSVRETIALREPWIRAFPMILEPATPTGFGVVVLNSNAETHFSMTNALGLVSLEDTIRLKQALARHPNAAWVVALHHHVVEYPMPVTEFSQRIGTALINGSWFARELLPLARRLVVMHGHRHIDWIGGIGDLRLISAPSPVMNGKDEEATYFLLHTIANDGRGNVALTKPERIDMPGDSAAEALESEQRLDLIAHGSGGGSALPRGRKRAAG